MKAYTNGGRQDSTQVADLPGFFTVWFNPASMLNILSWADVRAKYRITVDTDLGSYISVHLSATRVMIFEEVATGLYLFRNKAHVKHGNKISGYSYLLLTEANLSNFSQQQLQGADKARTLHRALGFPGYRNFLWLLKHNKIQHCDVIHDDAERALHIYGDEPAIAKGKMTRSKQSKANYVNRVQLPSEIIKNHRNVHLMVDYMFVQGVQFLTTISHELKFRTAEALPYVNKRGAKKHDILQGIQKVIKLYQARGLKIEQIHGDNELNVLGKTLDPYY